MESTRITKRNPWLRLAALALLLTAQVVSEAKQTAFSQIVVFGDSLSDTGNFYRLTGGTRPAPPNVGGRFCNGPVWIDYMADSLGMTLLPENNYAVGGATTGAFNSNNGYLGLTYPGLQNELDDFLQTLPPGGADPDALYVVWAGANDFFVFVLTGGDPASLIGNGVANTAHAIERLWAAGARHILVPNVPDLGLTPFASGMGLSGVVTQMSAAYNEVLGLALQGLADAGISTIQVDAFATLQSMVLEPATYGFADVLHPLAYTPGDFDPSEFVFWDVVHPTTRAQQVLGAAALRQTIDYFSPARSPRIPPGRVNALKGLVGAGQ